MYDIIGHEKRNMNKFCKEIIIVLIQSLMFYLFPLLLIGDNPMGMVLILIIVTFILALTLGIVSKERIKYLYPFAIAIIFIPSVYIYYNDSALVHSLWYLIVSLFGICLGSTIFNFKKRG